MQNRTAHRPAELVTPERRLAAQRIEVAAGIEYAVPYEVVDRAVQLVCSLTSDGVNDAPRRPTVLRRRVGRDDVELLDGVHAQCGAGNRTGAAVGVVIDAHSVQPIAVLLRAIAANGQLRSQPAGKTRGCCGCTSILCQN